MAKKARFPKYLNRNRLLYKWEYDQWIVAVVTFFAMFYIIGFFLSIDMFIAFAVGIFTTYKVLKIYNRVIKEAAPGFLFHFLYDIGLFKPKECDKCVKPPYGYERKFKD